MSDSLFSLDQISVVIPMYNSEKTILSLLNSALPLIDSGLTLVIIDDGSIDNSYSIVSSFKKNHPNIHLLHQDNHGRSSARNSGIKFCQTDWVTFADADDTIDTDGWFTLSKLLGNRCLVENIIQCNFICSRSDGAISEASFSNCLSNARSFDLTADIFNINGFVPDDFFWYEGGSHAIMSACTKIYKVSFLRTYHISFIESLSMFEDAIFNFDAFSKCSSVLMADIPIYNYHVNIGTTSRSHSLRSYSDSRRAIELISAKLSDGNYSVYIPHLRSMAVSAVLSRISFSSSSFAPISDICLALNDLCSSKVVLKLLIDYFNDVPANSLSSLWIKLKLYLIINKRFRFVALLCSSAAFLKRLLGRNFSKVS